MKQILEALRERLLEREDINLAFIFGSYVSGHISDESDVDIAILFKQIPEIAAINLIREISPMHLKGMLI